MQNLTLFSEGVFGAEVAERISKIVPGVRVLPLVASATSFEMEIRGSDFVGVALWRRYLHEADRLDGACAQEGIPWSSVLLEGTYIQCGPLITPGQGPCHACYWKRWLTHAPFAEREQALDSAYAADPGLGIRGFTPSAVRIAAAALLLDREEFKNASGRLRRIDLLHCAVEESRVVRVHGCDRCSHSTKPGERYFRELVDALKRNKCDHDR
jgi:bacteriocin biosynthesis cyclodehydratase domain-containing protein